MTTAHSSCPDGNHPHAIDLGLPSGTKWACCNVGASAPEAYGGYYAWGETEEKAVYDRESYTYYNPATGYCEYLGADIAGTSYDVAHVKWGGSWQMPSKAQQDELREKCRWTLATTREDTLGYHVVGVNGNHIFFPVAGWRNQPYPNRMRERAAYWSSTSDDGYPENACFLLLYKGHANYGWYKRLRGGSIRPVTK